MRSTPYPFRLLQPVSPNPGLVNQQGGPIFSRKVVSFIRVLACLSYELARSAPRSGGGIPMTPEKSQNVQDVFLNHVRKNKTPVTVFLVNGVKLQGIITWFDNFCVLLRRDAHSQLVYKHAISTVMPGQPIQLFDSNKEIDES
jgi:host factor-I protein